MSQVQEIKDAVSVVEIIGERLELTPSGSYYKGLCPFHGEKSPSFFVDERIGHWRCFGCSESGDVFSFLEKYDNLTFREALEYLADRAGIKLTQFNESQDDKLRRRVLAVLEKAAAYWQENLRSSQGEKARDYLAKRATSADSIKAFSLGYASDDWRAMTTYLKEQKFTSAELVAAGLVIEKNTGNIYDRFRDRLMFPLRNHRGQIVGFSGRTLSGDETEAKYINSPETILYHKAKMLYGLSENANFIKKSGSMVVVEGEFDMLSSLQAHVDNVVAIKGSALTPEHAKIMARFVKTVLLALDSDAAGIKATAHALEVLREQNLELKVIILPAGKDPDDYAKKNPGAWREQVERAVSPYEYFLQVAVKKYKLSGEVNIETKKLVLKELAPLFGPMDNLLEKNHYHKKLAALLHEDVEVVGRELDRLQKIGARGETGASKPVLERKSPVLGRFVAAGKNVPTPLQKQEMYLWFLYLQLMDGDPNEERRDFFFELKEWESKLAAKLAGFLRDFEKNTGHSPTLKAFTASLPADYQEKIAALLLSQTYTKLTIDANLEKEWTTALAKYQKEMARFKIKALKLALEELDSQETLDEAAEKKQTQLLTEVGQWQKKLLRL